MLSNEEVKEAMVIGVIDRLRVEDQATLNMFQEQHQLETNALLEGQERKFEAWNQRVEDERRVRAEQIVNQALNGTV